MNFFGSPSPPTPVSRYAPKPGSPAHNYLEKLSTKTVNTISVSTFYIPDTGHRMPDTDQKRRRTYFLEFPVPDTWHPIESVFKLNELELLATYTGYDHLIGTELNGIFDLQFKFLIVRAHQATTGDIPGAI